MAKGMRISLAGALLGLGLASTLALGQVTDIQRDTKVTGPKGRTIERDINIQRGPGYINRQVEVKRPGETIIRDTRVQTFPGGGAWRLRPAVRPGSGFYGGGPRLLRRPSIRPDRGRPTRSRLRGIRRAAGPELRLRWWGGGGGGGGNPGPGQPATARSASAVRRLRRRDRPAQELPRPQPSRRRPDAGPDRRPSGRPRSQRTARTRLRQGSTSRRRLGPRRDRRRARRRRPRTRRAHREASSRGPRRRHRGPQETAQARPGPGSNGQPLPTQPVPPSDRDPESALRRHRSRPEPAHAEFYRTVSNRLETGHARPDLSRGPAAAPAGPGDPVPATALDARPARPSNRPPLPGPFRNPS